jgi:propionyl-CoA carboxylase alpha chain
MGEAAISVCKSCNYEGAGTVEFLMDAELNFYFLEMNTRLQVEHPVTEEITGLDLVEWQIRIARGEKLPKSQNELKINGHAIEVRVYAEDSLNGFVPDIGTLNKYVRPVGSGIRVDDAFEEGMAIPIYYDPMIAKLVVWAESRDACIEKCIDAIKSYQISGVKTTLDFGLFVLNHESFRSGDFDTNFIKTHVPESKAIPNSMKDESDALLGSLDEIWNDLVKMKNTDFKSQKITESWKNQTNS